MTWLVLGPASAEVDDEAGAVEEQAREAEGKCNPVHIILTHLSHASHIWNAV